MLGLCKITILPFTAREILLEWDTTACMFVFSYWTWIRTWTCSLKVDLDLDLDFTVAGLVTSLLKRNAVYFVLPT